MAKKRKGLSDVHRIFLIREMACYSSPGEAADALKEIYGVEITPQGAQYYNPETRIGRELAKKWVSLFETTRAAFLKHITEEVPEAHKAVRVRELARASRRFKRSGNYVAMADMFERIAKEMGNVHTNRREFTGKDRGPVQFEDVSMMTDEQIAAELDELLRRKDPASVHPASTQKQ